MKAIGLRLGIGVLTLASIFLGGCTSAPPTSADTLCSDFMKLSASDRDAAVTRLAVELKNPEVVAPLIRPNVEYQCTLNPGMTVGQVIAASRLSGSPSDSPTVSPSTSEDPSGEESTTPPDESTDTAIVTANWTDPDGYSYEIAIADVAVTASVDVANAKPGEANLTWSVNAKVTARNTTESRNAPMPQIVGGVAWGMKQVVCAYARRYGTGNEPDVSLARPAANTCNKIGVLSFPGDSATKIGPGETMEGQLELKGEATVPEELADGAEQDTQDFAAAFLGYRAGTMGFDGCIADLGTRILAMSTALKCRSD